jgi:WD40 repeat protein
MALQFGDLLWVTYGGWLRRQYDLHCRNKSIDYRSRFLYVMKGDTLQVFKGHHGPIWSLQFAHNGESFASASEDGTIRIWYPPPVTGATTA